MIQKGVHDTNGTWDGMLIALNLMHPDRETSQARSILYVAHSCF